MRKTAYFRRGILLICSLFLAGCGTSLSAEDTKSQMQVSRTSEEECERIGTEEAIPVKVADFLAYDHPVNQLFLEVFKPMLEEKTQGRYTLEVYADGDLGGEEDFLKGIARGTIEIGIAGVELSDEYPALKVLDFPFVFSDVNNSFSALHDEEVMREMNRQIAPSQIICRGFVLTGVRAISNNVRPIYSPEDCRGLTIREPNVSQFIEYAERLGFETITASVPEIYTVLQQGLADGQENPPIALLTSKWYQVQKYLSLTNHQITYNWLAVNRGFYEGMSAEDQQIFDECCMAYVDAVKESYLESEKEVLKMLEEKGIEILQVDREPFKRIAREMEEEYCEDNPAFQEMLLLLASKGGR